MTDRSFDNTPDIRQSPEWGRYLENIGWVVEKAGDISVAINRLPLFGRSVIKIQHPMGEIPFQKINAIAQKYKALFVLVEPMTVGYDEKVFASHGYRPTHQQFAPTATIKIDLKQSEKDLLKSFSDNARRNIKKSQAANLKLQSILLRDDKNYKAFDDFYRLHENLGRMKHFYVPSREHMLKKARAMKDVTVLFFAYEKGDDVPIATVWTSIKDGVMTYLHTGITDRGYELLANYILVWEAMVFAKKQKCSVFDFEIIFDERYPKENRRWIGYTQFKKRFHGRIVEYPPRWIKHYSPVYKFFDLCISRFQ